MSSLFQRLKGVYASLAGLASGVGAALVGFVQSGAGAVLQTVQAKLRRVSVDVEDFGQLGNNTTGDDAVFQAAIDHIHKLSDDTGAQGTLRFSQPIFLTSPKNFGKNIRLVGRGRGFRSVIKPLASFSGGYIFGIDGDLCVGGFAFRVRHENFTIDNSFITTKAQVPITYFIRKAYDIALKDVWVYNARGTAIQIETSNLVMLENPCLYGVSADPSSSEYAIRVLSAGSGGGGGGVKIINPDVEVWFKGIRQEAGSRVDVVNPYCERNIVGWEAVGTANGAMTVFGGQVESPGASGTAALIAGDNVTVVGGIYRANGGNGLVVSGGEGRKQNVRLYNPAGDVSDLRSYALRDMDSMRWYMGKARSQKDVSDAVATTFFAVVVPFLSAHFGVVEVTVNARDASGYSLWTAKYRFAVSNPDGTLRVTPVVEYAKTNVNISANYSLAVTCATSVSGSTCNFQITADSGGSLGNGQSPRISAEAELLQWDAAGGVYISAA